MRPSLQVLLAAALWLPFCHASAAEPAKVIALWPDTAPGEKEHVGEEHDTTKSDGRSVADRRVIRLSGVSKPTLTIYSPPQDENSGVGIVVCPGGGYSILAMDLEGTEVCDWLNSIGVTAALLKYRVPKREGDDGHKLPLQDAQRALGLLRQRAKEWQIDPARIGALGFSAGGHLVASLSNNYGQRAYPPVDEADSVSCRPDFTILIYPAYLVPKESEQLAPEMRITEKTPPTFITMALDDPLRIENALAYARALREAKVPFELHVHDSGGHGFGLRPVKGVSATAWPERVTEWMRGQGLLKGH